MPETIDPRDRVVARYRLLDTAERLFAQKGVAETSVRTITAEAGMNVAAVNYYFSSKEQLFAAVMDRRVPPLLAAREAGLVKALEEGGEVEAILRAIFEPSVRIGFEHPHFARLASRLRYEEDSSRWQNYRTRQGDLPERFQSALAAALPDLDPEEVRRRFHLVMGAVGQIWANMPPKGGESPESMIERHVTFFGAGMRASTG